MSLNVLPEDCFAHIVSLTSPGDACCLSLVSLSVHSIANLDNVWLKFLPSDYREIVSRLVDPLEFSSNKELFMRLCSPRLIDGGRKIFFMEKSTYKKCFLLSARELKITWSSYPLYWTWKPLLESRFAEVAELRTICWLEISSTVNIQMLSPRTAYGAYLIVKLAERAYGLDSLPSEVSVQVGNVRSQAHVYLSRREGKKQPSKQLDRKKGSEAFRTRVFQGEKGALLERKDGWQEIELGSFYNDGNDKEVHMSLKEVKGQQLKGGIIVEGIELRPKD